DLVSLARGLIVAPGEARAMLSGSRTLAPTISTACEALLGDALSRLWPALWRRGGTAPSASIEGGQVRRGRIWERHAPRGRTSPSRTPGRWRGGGGRRRGEPSRIRAGVARGAGVEAQMQMQPPTPPIDRLDAALLTVGDQVMIYLALDAAAG